MITHDSLLLACGTQESRRLLRGNLEENYHLLEAATCRQALLLLEQNAECIAAVVIDITAPRNVDLELLRSETGKTHLAHIPVIVITRSDDPAILDEAFTLGASDVIPLHYDPYAMLRRIETIVQLSLHKQNLEDRVREQARVLRQANDTMVDALSSIIEYRSVESGQHILRIRQFTKVLLEQVAEFYPEYNLTPELISIISSASALHDVGKIGIPDSILTKPGKLTPEEIKIMQTHTTIGCQILESLGSMGNTEYLRYAHNICHYHHERWDGSGYPAGLAGDAIPICAQVVGLADAYDALTTKRVYKDAYPMDTAVNMILSGECGVFSPRLLECFKLVVPKYKELAHAYADGFSPKNEKNDVSLPEVEASDAVNANILSGKFLSLLHYIDAFVLELAVDQGYYHLRYNPYPELAIINQANTFTELRQLILDRIVVPEDREQMAGLMDYGIEEYLRAGLRRQSFRFCFQSRQGGAIPYEVTLLRSDVNQKGNRSLAILCRKLSQSNPFGLRFTPAAESNFKRQDYICCRNDRYFSFVRAGQGIHQLALYHIDEIPSVFNGRLLELVYPEDRQPLLETFREQFSQGNDAQAEFRVIRKDGQLAWMICKSYLVTEKDGNECMYCYLTDITATRKAYDALNHKLERYEIILAQTENVLFEWEIDNDQSSFSDTWTTIFGTEPPSGNFRKALTDGAYTHPDDLPLVLDRLKALENGSPYEMQEIRFATSWGRYLWCRVRASALRRKDGSLDRIVGLIVNIDEEKQMERALQDRADRDMLTKLLNKDAGRKQIEEYLSQFPKGVSCAMLIIDLDNFKQINDRFGHLFGDTVLIKVAKEIKKMFRAQDIITRIGGDEFLVLIRGVSDLGLVEARCQRLLTALHSAFLAAEQELSVSCSIGVAVAPDHGIRYLELFHHADLALYLAKAQGRDRFAVYSPEAARFGTMKANSSAVNQHIDSDDTPGLANSSLVQYAFRQLYAARDLDSAIQEALALIGKQTNVSRVYVFENSLDNRCCSNTYEWCNTGIRPEIQNLQQVSYETDIPGYELNFDENGILYCSDIQLMESSVRDILAAQGIKSILQCAIRENGVFLGYIGFDECVYQRMWTQEQIDLLTYFSEILSVFLLKRRSQTIAQLQIQQLQRQLDGR